MSIFSNPFFSVSGQLERLKNVGQTLVAAVVPEKVQKAVLPKSLQVGSVQANTGSKFLNKVLETGANHPFATALAGTIIANPALAVAAGKEVATKAVVGIKGAASNVARFATKGAAAAKEVGTKVAMPIAVAKAAVPRLQAQGTVGALPSPVPNQLLPGAYSGTLPAAAANVSDSAIAVDPLYTTGNAQTATQIQQLYDLQLQQNTLGGATTNEFLKQTVGQIGGGTPSTNIGGGLGSFPSGGTRSKAVSRKRSSKRKATRKRSRVHKHKGKSRKTKKRNTHKIYYTKRGQPYKILASGKARFMSKRGAKSAKHRRGGLR